MWSERLYKTMIRSWFTIIIINVFWGKLNVIQSLIDDILLSMRESILCDAEFFFIVNKDSFGAELIVQC